MQGWWVWKILNCISKCHQGITLHLVTDIDGMHLKWPRVPEVLEVLIYKERKSDIITHTYVCVYKVIQKSFIALHIGYFVDVMRAKVNTVWCLSSRN